MGHKLVKDINEETWKKFIAYCKLKDVTVGKQLDEVLNKFLKTKLKRLLE